MSVAPPQVVQLACPNCRTPMRAQVLTLIDVGRQPELKSYLLSGQLNMVVCPNCGNVSVLAAPLIYHDPAKQLFFVHFPQQLNARPEEQERFIGDATSIIMRGMPADAPRGYVLAPRRFLSLNSLIEAVLEADGITREMVEAQRARVEQISALAEAYEQGDEAFAAAVEQHRDELNEEFFTMLAAFAQASAQDGRPESQVLVDLYERLAELTGFAPQDAEGEEGDISLDDVIERLASAEGVELQQIIAELRPALDYTFFEVLTTRIEAAQIAGATDEAQRLTLLRETILATVEEMDRQAKELFEAGASLLNEALDAEDLDAVLRANGEKIDEAFLLVIEANQGAAERAGRTDIVERLGLIRERAVAIAEEALSPEDRLINQLLNAETPQSATSLLRQNTPMITVALVKRINELSDQFEQEGRKEGGERLRQLGREAGAMLF